MKGQEKKVGQAEVEEFLRLKDIAQRLDMRGYYILYSLNGFDDDAIDLLCRNSIMYADAGSWEVWPGVSKR